MLKSLACALVLLSAVSPPLTAARAGAPTVVIVVRHAEKADVPGNDPPLSPAGVERAESLAEIAEQAGVQVVFTTDRLRTKQTARPFLKRRPDAASAEFKLNTADADAHLKEMADAIRQKHKGKTVLVVGHNTTAPALVNRLADGANFSALDEKTEFDAVFVVIIPDGGPARAIKAKYGRAIDPRP